MRRLEFRKIDRAAAMMQPSHDESIATDNLLSIDTDVMSLLVWPLRNNKAKSDQLSCIIGPTGLDR